MQEKNKTGWREISEKKKGGSRKIERRRGTSGDKTQRGDMTGKKKRLGKGKQSMITATKGKRRG